MVQCRCSCSAVGGAGTWPGVRWSTAEASPEHCIVGLNGLVGAAAGARGQACRPQGQVCGSVVSVA